MKMDEFVRMTRIFEGLADESLAQPTEVYQPQPSTSRVICHE